MEDASPPVLVPRRVEVWRVSLDDDAPLLPARRAVLTTAELARAERFAFPENRNLYILVRGRLRELLGHYLGLVPHAVRLEPGPHGKPELASGQTAGGPHFNVAHSGRLACIAVTIEGPVGVDVERIRPDVAASGLAERFFSPPEVAELRALPPEGQERAFFECWTRKEAYIKALGTGLTEPLDRFGVSFGPDRAAALTWVAARSGEAAQWSIRALQVDEGYVGAVAIRCQDVNIGVWG